MDVGMAVANKVRKQVWTEYYYAPPSLHEYNTAADNIRKLLGKKKTKIAWLAVCYLAWLFLLAGQHSNTTGRCSKACKTHSWPSCRRIHP